MLAATRGGSADALRAELAESRPDLLRYLSNQVPSMYSKAYRWVAELDEIAFFVGDERVEHVVPQTKTKTKKYYDGRIITNINLNGRGSKKETRPKRTTSILTRLWSQPFDGP